MIQVMQAEWDSINPEHVSVSSTKKSNINNVIRVMQAEWDGIDPEHVSVSTPILVI